ncbi:MAG TPA: AMP-binding protein [Vineibacter sp.]|nr:AMP-binding protein [Vineibacter sp.]
MAMNAAPYRTPPGVGIDHLLRRAAMVAPDRIALRDDAGAITYGDAEAQANRLAAWLAAADGGPPRVRKGDRAAVILPNGIAFIVAELALLRRGLVKVPLNIRFAADEVLYALRDSEPTVLVATADYCRRVLERRHEAPSLRSIICVGEPVAGTVDWQAIVDGPPVAPVAAVPYADDDVILIRYTGGTTGRPKGVVHTHRSYLAIVLDVVRELAIPDDDVALHLGHLSHGLNFMWPAWYLRGATQVLRERFEPQAVWRDFRDQGVSWVYMVPTMIHMLLEADDGTVTPARLRQFMYASAPMPVPLLRRALARFGPLFAQVYTLSEAPVITTFLPPAEHLESANDIGPPLASVGRPVATMELRLIDDDGREVPRGAAGEIAVRSINNMAGYWNLPAETAKTLVDGWLRTGDMARQADDGLLHLVDRKKDIVITGGFNVWPKEVEDVLHRHPAVAQAAVVGAPDEKWGEIVVAYVVPRPGARVDTEELVALCREHLADFKKPRRIHVVDALPTTPVGKISRAALRQMARGE